LRTEISCLFYKLIVSAPAVNSPALSIDFGTHHENSIPPLSPSDSFRYRVGFACRLRRRWRGIRLGPSAGDLVAAASCYSAANADTAGRPAI
jgi:hypothetical protein